MCGEFGGRDVVLNTLMFLPFGAGLRLAGWSVRAALVAITGATFSVELLQYTLVPGRDASGGDVVMNVLGGALGIAVASAWRSLLLPSPVPARWLSLAASVALTAILAASAWGVDFAPSTAPYFWGQWAHRFPRRAHFEGRVLTAEAAGLPMPDGRLAGMSEELRARLRNDARIEATVIPAGPTPGSAPVLTITSGKFDELLTLEQHGRDLIFGAHMRANELSLGSPRLRIRDAFPAAAPTPASADTMTLRGELRDGRLAASVVSKGEVIGRSLQLGAWSGWSFFVPFPAAFGAPFRWLTAFWSLGLLLPIGYWIALASAPSRTRGGVMALLLLAVPVAGIALVEIADGLPSDRLALAAAVVGLTCGWWLGRWSPGVRRGFGGPVR